MSKNLFEISDLNEANPDVSDFRHPRIRKAGNLISKQRDSFPEADQANEASIVLSLTRTHSLWLPAAAAIASEVTHASFWDCRNQGHNLWRHEIKGSLALEPPYTKEQLENAALLTSGAGVLEMLGTDTLDTGETYMPVLNNEQAGLHRIIRNDAGGSRAT